LALATSATKNLRGFDSEKRIFAFLLLFFALIEKMTTHKAGFVNIIGRPNVGKSTLMNALVGERMSIITPKPQTTRHRIIGLLNGDDYQVVFSDTPGIIKKPSYKMQEMMNAFVKTSFDDADVLLFTTEPAEQYDQYDPILEQLNTCPYPVFLLINKIDANTPENVADTRAWWLEHVPNFAEIHEIAAKPKHGRIIWSKKLSPACPKAQLIIRKTN
jgi:GTPase